MIDLKTEDDAQDLAAWKWLLNLLDHLGEDGMSFKESDINTRTGMEVYYIKELMWHRDVQHKMVQGSQLLEVFQRCSIPKIGWQI